jgi:hypothetical protein
MKKKKTNFRSGFEQRVSNFLDTNYVNYDYERESFIIQTPLRKNKIECSECGNNKIIQTRKYTPDFFLENGVIIEAKGRLTADNKNLYKAFVEQYPDVDFRMVFMRDNKIGKGDKKYSDWCESLGIKCHFSPKGVIPKDWLR